MMGGGPPRTGEIEELNSRLNAIRSGRLTLSFVPSTERDPDENAGMQDILNKRLNRLRYGPSVLTSTEKFLARRQQLRDNEISQIPKGLVSTRRGELFPGEFSSPPGSEFFEPPPVVPADDSFIRPGDLPDVPQTPIVGKFSRPLTKVVDDRKNTIEITSKKSEADIEEKNLSQSLAEPFPDINEVLEEDKKNEGIQDVIENLEEILSKIDRKTPFEFEFFTGGKNETFDEFMRGAALSPYNLEFLDFLQLDQCKQIFIENKIKINIESGNIYYNNTDTNEGILDLIFNQQNPVTGDIPYNLTYGDSYKNYFNWLMTGFDSYEKAELDILKFKNAKYLFYRFNNFLSESNVQIKKIKHSTVTDDFIAAEEIQNQNWQYYIEQVIEFCHNKEIGKTIRTPQSNLLFDTVINITEAKQSYNTFYNTVLQSFHLTIEKLAFEEKEKIREDFERENFSAENLIQDFDHWVSFFLIKVDFQDLKN